MERVRLVLAGGGTGGHLVPALNLTEELVRLGAGTVSVKLVGASRGVDATVLPRRGYPYVLLPVEPLYRARPWRNLRSGLSFGASLRAVRRLFADFPPHVVVGTGGYVCGPVLAWALRRGIPTVLQEQNRHPGMTTRLFARCARQIHLGYPEALRHLRVRPGAKVTAYGNPVRCPERPLAREEARRQLGLGRSPVVLVVGGSQGARPLNDALLRCVQGVMGGRLPELPERAELYWAVGPAHHEAVQARFGPGGPPPWVRLVPYIDNMPLALAAADLAVSRAGGMALAELCAWGVPMILVPLPHAAGDHQRRNAEALAAIGAAEVLPQAVLESQPMALWRRIAALVSDPSRRDAMAQAARTRSSPDAAHKIAADILELASLRSRASGGGWGG